MLIAHGQWLVMAEEMTTLEMSEDPCCGHQHIILLPPPGGSRGGKRWLRVLSVGKTSPLPGHESCRGGEKGTVCS